MALIEGNSYERPGVVYHSTGPQYSLSHGCVSMFSVRKREYKLVRWVKERLRSIKKRFPSRKKSLLVLLKNLKMCVVKSPVLHRDAVGRPKEGNEGAQRSYQPFPAVSEATTVHYRF